MVIDAIRLVLTNLAVLLFVAAVVLAAILRRPAGFSIRLLNLLLLLSVGIEEAWAGFFHVFFPETAAASIGFVQRVSAELERILVCQPLMLNGFS